MSTGWVKWFDEVKGYGFITPDDGSEDVFVHYSAIKAKGFKKLAQDQRVVFNVKMTDKGPKAEDVELSLI
jgi:CspA family cold shock protein